MKRLLVILLANFLLVESRMFLDLVDDEGKKSSLPLPSRQTCSSNSDCGENDCCFELTGECYPRPTLNGSCSPESTCSCAAGLVCKEYMRYKDEAFHRCMQPDQQ